MEVPVLLPDRDDVLSECEIPGDQTNLIKYWGLDPSTMGEFEENIGWIAASRQTFHPLSFCQITVSPLSCSGNVILLFLSFFVTAVKKVMLAYRHRQTAAEPSSHLTEDDYEF